MRGGERERGRENDGTKTSNKLKRKLCKSSMAPKSFRFLAWCFSSSSGFTDFGYVWVRMCAFIVHLPFCHMHARAISSSEHCEKKRDQQPTHMRKTTDTNHVPRHDSKGKAHTFAFTSVWQIKKIVAKLFEKLKIRWLCRVICANRASVYTDALMNTIKVSFQRRKKENYSSDGRWKRCSSTFVHGMERTGNIRAKKWWMH